MCKHYKTLEVLSIYCIFVCILFWQKVMLIVGNDKCRSIVPNIVVRFNALRGHLLYFYSYYFQVECMLIVDERALVGVLNVEPARGMASHAP